MAYRCFMPLQEQGWENEAAQETESMKPRISWARLQGLGQNEQGLHEGACSFWDWTALHLNLSFIIQGVCHEVWELSSLKSA